MSIRGKVAFGNLLALIVTPFVDPRLSGSWERVSAGRSPVQVLALPGAGRMLQFALPRHSFGPLMRIAREAFVPLQRLEVLRRTSAVVDLQGSFLMVVQSHAR